MRPRDILLIVVGEVSKSTDPVGDGKVEPAVEREDLALEGLAVERDGVAVDFEITLCFLRHGCMNDCKLLSVSVSNGRRVGGRLDLSALCGVRKSGDFRMVGDAAYIAMKGCLAEVAQVKSLSLELMGNSPASSKLP